MKMNGTNVAFGQFTVAANGKTMTANSTFGPPGPTQERVTIAFDKY